MTTNINEKTQIDNKPHASNTNNDENNFTLVSRNGKSNHKTQSRPLVKKHRTSEPVFGTKISENKTIAGERIIRKFDIFVGGVSNQINEELFKNYLETEIGITPLSVILNKENEYNRSYKVSVSNTEKNIIFNPALWDNNIIVKPYRKKRLYTNISQNLETNGNQEDFHRSKWI